MSEWITVNAQPAPAPSDDGWVDARAAGPPDGGEWQTVTSPAPEEHGFVSSLVDAAKGGLVQSARDFAKLGRVGTTDQGGSSSPPPGEPTQPYAQPLAWSDLLHPTRLAAKTVYGVSYGAPELAGATLGGMAGAAAGSEGGPLALVTAALGAGGGAAVVNLFKTLGPFYAEEIQAGKKPAEAYSAAIKRASISGITSGASFALFDVPIFKNALGDLLAQAFAVQPAVAATGRAGQNLATGRPVGEGVAAAALESVPGTLLPAGAHYLRGHLPAMIAEHVEPVRNLARKTFLAGVADDIRKVINPAGRGPEARQTAQIVRARQGEFYRSEEMSRAEYHRLHDTVAGLTPEQQLAFIDNLEGGRSQTAPALQPVADALRDLLDNRRERIRDLGRRDGKNYLQDYIENYFPHIFKKRGETPTGFLKQRKYRGPLLQVLREHPDLELVSNNPLDLTALRVHQMDKFILGREIWNDLKTNKLVRFVRDGERAPDGWQPVDDRIARVRQYSEPAKGFVERGNYYAPEPVTTLLGKVFDPGIRGRFPTVFRSMQAVKNTTNILQLGFSLLHGGFEFLDVPASHFALAIQELTRGRPLSAAKQTALGGLLGLNVARQAWRGYHIRRAYLGQAGPPEWMHRMFGLGPYGPEMEGMVRAVMESGGRVGMPQIYKAAEHDPYWQAITRATHAPDTTTTTVLKFLPRLAQRVSAPLMEHMVPMVKLGVFADMVKASVERDPNMTGAEFRGVMAKHLDSVDNRLGELNMDNLFLGRTLTDSLWLALRSPGWKIGTLKEMGGGVLDAAAQAKGALKGRGFQVTNRMAYVLGSTLSVFMVNAIYQYLATGQPPQEMKDYLFPKDGGMDHLGNPTRRRLPAYLTRDIAGFYEAPVHEAVAGLSPPLEMGFQLAENRDYQGAAIHDIRDPAWRQRLDDVAFMLRQFMPFSLTQRSQAMGHEHETDIPSFFGMTPAPGWITRTPEQNQAFELMGERGAIRRRIRERLRSGSLLP